MPEHEHIETFFTDLRDTHLSGVGVRETSYYPYLANLLNTIGKSLKPCVRCILHPHSIGAGLPDGALITTDQKSSADDPLADGLIPSRGVMEIKAPDEDAQATANSEQVTKYINKYGLVLVTNLREFIIMARIEGQPRQLEAFTISPSEKAFWKALANPKKLTESLGASFHEYLVRVLLQAAPLSSPKEVAWFLASYARDAKARMEGMADLPGLSSLRSALEEALGLKFTGQGGGAFFPLFPGTDVVLRRVFGVGAMVQASHDGPESEIQLARGRMVAARANDKDVIRAIGDANEASGARTGGGA